MYSLEIRSYPEPIELACKLDLNFIQGNIIKHITKYRDFGYREDLEEVIYYAENGLELNPDNHYEYSRENSEELDWFVDDTEFYGAAVDIIYATVTQKWEEIISKCELLISLKHANEKRGS